MWNWLRRRGEAPVDESPPPLTDAQVREWRAFVAECNRMLGRKDVRPALYEYAQRIRDAVIHRRITVEEFQRLHPPPWETMPRRPRPKKAARVKAKTTAA